MIEFMSQFGLGCFFGVLGLWAWALWTSRKPARQRIKPMAIVYCVARFDCGCVLVNGRLTTCAAHELMESVI